ncbi:NACHT, LRR and PYD domains-containing protein 12-like, partial [Sinocyclocheilus grahami]|uniref:NACHT, LRR and PYD domains-containing protein 12-like n=1 Tax=Sinocyclocheilus grahami TaxID=75366 RepID=UPI0007AD6300
SDLDSGSNRYVIIIVQYIKQKFEANLSPERSINLFYCLNELNDQTLVKDIQTHLSKGSLSSADLSPAQWSALVFVLLTSEEELQEFELQKFKKSDECLIRLSAVIKTSKRALLNDCDLTDKSCPALATVLGSDTNLKELNMNNNNLQDSGVKLLCTGLKNINCKLEILRLNDCDLTDKSCPALATVLGSDTNLKELNMNNNNLQDSGVKLLCTGLKNINCKLEILSFLKHVIGVPQNFIRNLQSVLLPFALSLSTSLSQSMHSVHARAQYFLSSYYMCESVVGAKEYFLSSYYMCESVVGAKEFMTPFSNRKLKDLSLKNNCITEGACHVLAAALNSNPSNLTELDLSRNQIADSGVTEISSLLRNSQTLQILSLKNNCITEGACHVLAEALNSNPSNLTELDLSENKLGNPGMKIILTLFENVQCRLQKLKLNNCELTEKSCLVLATVLSSKTILKEINLNSSRLLDSGVKEICEGLKNPVCELKILK